MLLTVVQISRKRGNIEFQPSNKDKPKSHQRIMLPIQGGNMLTPRYIYLLYAHFYNIFTSQ